MSVAIVILHGSGLNSLVAVVFWNAPNFNLICNVRGACVKLGQVSESKPVLIGRIINYSQGNSVTFSKSEIHTATAKKGK